MNSGDRVYFVNRDRTLFAAVIGQENLENGIRMVAAHGDSPRIDLKPNPLYLGYQPPHNIIPQIKNK